MSKSTPSRPRGRSVAKPAPARLTRRQLALAWSGIVLFALLLRAVHLWQLGGALFYQVLSSDPREYDRWAQTVAGGDWLGSEVFYQTPLYPYLLAVIYVPFGHNVWAVRICQALFGAAACVLIGRAAARFFDERVGMWSGMLLALYPPAIFFDGILQKASLDLLLMCALLWLMAMAQDRRRGGWFLALGAVLGTTILNRENAAALFPVLALWIGWLAWPGPWRRGLGWLAAFAAGTALVLVPVGARNYYVGGLFALTTSQMGTNFYIGNYAGANGTYEALREGRGDPQFERLDARMLAEDDLRRPLSPGEVSRYWMGRAWSDIRQDPFRWLRLLAWKWLLTWHRVEMVDSESLYTHARYSTVLAVMTPVWHLGVLAPLAAAGIWYSRRDWRKLAGVYVVLAAMAAAVTLFYVFARYRYPLVPPLILFGAAGVVGTWQRVRAGVWANARELAVAAAVACLAAWVCNVRLVQAYDDDAVTFHNAADEFRNQGRAADAIAMWQLALEADPDFQLSLNELGRFALAQGDLELARSTFERGVRYHPHNARLLFGLGRARAELGDEAEAVELIAAAARANPQFLPALASLAREERAAGRFRAAVAVLRALVQAQGESALAHAELGAALHAAGREPEAAAELRHALKLDGGMIAVANDLAWLLATSRDDSVRSGAEAVALAEAACRAVDDKSPELLDTLAAGYAETGQFEQAVAACDRALALPGDRSQQEGLRQRRALYLEGRPFRDRTSAPHEAAQP